MNLIKPTLRRYFPEWDGHMPYKEPTGKIYGKITLERARELYRENKNQSIKQGA
jgi:hypothetical protein